MPLQGDKCFTCINSFNKWEPSFKIITLSDYSFWHHLVISTDPIWLMVLWVPRLEGDWLGTQSCGYTNGSPIDPQSPQMWGHPDG